MIIFENDGEIDPQLISLIGVNVKETENAIGFFGTGLKYAVACLARWEETMIVHTGASVLCFETEHTTIRGKEFGLIRMRSHYGNLQLGFTTDLGKRWEPWMVYRELWCNAHDEPNSRVYETDKEPEPKAGITRIIVNGPQIQCAHDTRHETILLGRKPLHILDGMEVYEGAGKRVFYRGIAVQDLDNPGLYTYNITSHLWLTEDRTAGSWQTNQVIARGLTQIEDRNIIDATLTATPGTMESRLDYDYAQDPGELWVERAEVAIANRPFAVPSSVRGKFVHHTVETCPTCGRAR